MSEEKISAALKYWRKHKANEYACPDCGRMVNRTTVSRHNQTMHHELAVLKKLQLNQSRSNIAD